MFGNWAPLLLVNPVVAAARGPLAARWCCHQAPVAAVARVQRRLRGAALRGRARPCSRRSSPLRRERLTGCHGRSRRGRGRLEEVPPRRAVRLAARPRARADGRACCGRRKPEDELEQPRVLGAARRRRSASSAARRSASSAATAPARARMLKLLDAASCARRSGSIRVRGRLSALIEVSAGFHPDLTGRENIFLNGAILGMTREEITRTLRRDRRVLGARGVHRHAGEALLVAACSRGSASRSPRTSTRTSCSSTRCSSVGDYLFQRKCARAHGRGDRERRHGHLRVAQPARRGQTCASAACCSSTAASQMIGPTEEVISTYYRPRRSRSGESRRAGASSITEVTIHDDERPARRVRRRATS